MVITICTKKFCAPTGPEKYLPKSRVSRVANVEPLFNFRNATDGSATFSTNYQNFNQGTKNNLQSAQLEVKKSPLLKRKYSSEQMQLSKGKLAKDTVGKNLDKILDQMRPRTPITTAGSTTDSILSAKRKPPSRQSLTTKASERNSRPNSVSPNDQKLYELKEMQNLLQKSSYVPKEKPVGRRPTIEVIKDAIEREKNKANDKNVGPSYNALTSDVSTNTNKKRKLFKKKRAQSVATTSKQSSTTDSSKLKNKSIRSVKPQGKTAANKKKTVAIRKKVNPKTTVSIGVQYSIIE